ncbi:hypothetical protein CSW14_05400 [Thermus scotoductus]|uniref:Uncharacterized protein n=1 Tax=Thermus scotoductus TaxID=37636 RepID=A0A430VSZ3_THESC|nr:hypothetical protein [Thermus scotoductus]RTI57139.1 hypothetical protein CSW14_05400 [Thermus scotoductus]
MWSPWWDPGAGKRRHEELLLEAEGGGVVLEGGIPVYRVSLGEGRLRVPEGAEVLLLAKGSHVELAGVLLKGRALGANLEGDGLLGLDLALSGGNLEAGLGRVKIYV